MFNFLQKSKLPIVFGVFFLFLLHIPHVMVGIRDALRICGTSIIPSLFVYLVLSEYISTLIFSEKLPSGLIKWVIFLLGSVCGFPIGAAMCEFCVQNNILTDDEANRLLPFCNNTSPAFLLGVVGNGIFGDLRVGRLILIIELLLSFCMILPIKIREKSSSLIESRSDLQSSILHAVEKAIPAMLKICALICLFSAILSIGKAYLSSKAFVLLATVLELGNGVSAVHLLGKNALAAGICGFACGWSGICVYVQILSVAKSIKVKQIRYLFCRFVYGILLGVLTYTGYKIWIYP